MYLEREREEGEREREEPQKTNKDTEGVRETLGDGGRGVRGNTVKKLQV